MGLRKTYGVTGKLEITVQIPLGSGSMTVPFTGGYETAIGITPATFTTKDPFVQGVIERSALYRKGRITLERVEDVEEETRLSEINREKSGLIPIEEPTGEADEERTETEESGMEVIEVSCLSDARRICRDRWGYKDNSVRKRDDVMRAGEQHGVIFKL